MFRTASLFVRSTVPAVLIAMLFGGCSKPPPPRDSPGSPTSSAAPAVSSPMTIGVNYTDWANAYGSEASTEALRDLHALGVRQVTYVPTWYQDGPQATSIDRLEGRTPDHGKLVLDLRRARNMGFELGLNLHIDLYDDSARSRIGFSSNEVFEIWWEQYTDIVMAYAEIARKERVELFSVGCELSGVAIPRYTRHWKALIAAVRKMLAPHGGRVTYTARHQNLANIEFLPDLDVIGINAWPSFRNVEPVSIDALGAAWRRAYYLSEDFAEVRSDANSYAGAGYEIDFMGYACWIAETYGRPVIISEFGCPSRQGALTQPVNWQVRGNPDGLTQALFFDGFFSELARHKAEYEATKVKPYPVEGVLIWNYAIKHGGPMDTDYTFRNKPLSEAVLKKHLAGFAQ